MKLLADESVDRPIVVRLRQDGHDVMYVAELSPGVSDDKVLDQAVKEQRVLLTGDKDFGDLVYRQKKATTGVVLFRLEGISATDKAELVSSAIQMHGKEFIGKFAVISSTAIRIRSSAL